MERSLGLEKVLAAHLPLEQVREGSGAVLAVKFTPPPFSHPPFRFTPERTISLPNNASLFIVDKRGVDQIALQI